MALLWPDLPPELRIPVAGYSLLLTAMAFGALRAGPWAALGGLLFLLSDTLIATGIAEWPQLPGPQFWIMLTYVAAQCALAFGVLRAAAAPRGPRAAAQPHPYGRIGRLSRRAPRRLLGRSRLSSLPATGRPDPRWRGGSRAGPGPGRWGCRVRPGR